MYFRYFVQKGQGTSFEQTWILFTQEYFEPSLVEIGPVVLDKKMKKWKGLQMDDRKLAIRKAHWAFSWGELKIQFDLILTYFVNMYKFLKTDK